MGFQNTVVILTSNVGSHFILDALNRGLDASSVETEVMALLRGQFRPEFLNRLDDIIVFDALNQADLERIVDIQLGGLRGRLLERRIHLSLTPDARALLAREGFDPLYGARPLKRTLSKELENPLAREILAGRVQDGSSVTVDAQSGRIEFSSTGLN